MRVFLEQISKVRFNRIAKENGVGNLHHRGFQVQGEEYALVFRFGKGFFIEFAKRFFTHKSSIYHFARLQRNIGFEYLHLVFRAYQFYTHYIGFFEGYRLLVVIEIARLHRCDFSETLSTPRAH